MPQSLLEATRLVLIHPSLPDNVGSVARSMRHFGLCELVLVGGVAPTHPLAIAASAGAEEILGRARVVETLDEALAGAGIAFGTTARPQSGVERRVLSPGEGARLAAQHAATAPVALVFGTEKDGMRVSELRRCDQILTIPGTAHACLNLAQAATVLAYEWRLASEHALPAGVPLSAAARTAGVADLAEAIATALEAHQLLKPHERESKLHALRRIVSQAQLAPDDAALLFGLARGLQAKAPKP